MGYGHNLNLLITLHRLCVSFPTRSGCREKHIRLKASLDYCEEVHRPKFLGGGGMEQYDWQQASRGLHYSQDLSSGELQA
jgi:hypothetical protein